MAINSLRYGEYLEGCDRIWGFTSEKKDNTIGGELLGTEASQGQVNYT